MEVSFMLRPLCLRLESQIPGLIGGCVDLRAAPNAVAERKQLALVWHRTLMGELVRPSRQKQDACLTACVGEALSDDVTQSSRHYVTLGFTWHWVHIRWRNCLRGDVWVGGCMQRGASSCHFTATFHPETSKTLVRTSYLCLSFVPSQRGEYVRL
jgi:hypothetical protein